MQGSIRFVLGLLMAFGAVGTLDMDPSADLLVQFALALAGCAVMYSGVLANQRANNG